MAKKPSPRNWKDVQMMFAAISMALTLTLWNFFAGPDREAAAKRADELASAPRAQPCRKRPLRRIELRKEPPDKKGYNRTCS